MEHVGKVFMKRCFAIIFVFFVFGALQSYSGVSSVQVYGLERMARFELLPYFLQGAQVRQVSSYDRSGGNDDGFNGTYSYRYVDENDEYVMFDDIGAGCLYRIWKTYGQSRTDYSNSVLRFYFDNELEPRLEKTMEEFFVGVHPPLLFPLVGRRHQSSHGYYCYLPFPYRERLKITLDRKPFFYNFTYHRFDDPEGVVTWTGSEDSKLVRDQWNARGIDPKPATELSQVTGSIDLPSGTTGTVFQIEGTGSIQTIQFKPSVPDSNTLFNVWLEMRWDGIERAVKARLGDFFGSHAKNVTVQSLPIGMSLDDYWYCYFPMPYWESAAIRLINYGTQDIPPIEFIIAHSTNSYDRSLSGYFHASYNELEFQPDGLDFVALNTKGRGHVVGLSMYMMSTNAGGYANTGYLEGDERIYTDGNQAPAVHGTGTEDYFNAGWYFNWGLFNLPYHGHPWRDHFNTDRPNHTQAYRFHLSDIIPFSESIQFGLEKGPNNNVPGRYCSVTYFYKSPDTRPGIIMVADLDVGDRWSEELYSYAPPADSVAVSNEWQYVGDSSFLLIVDQGLSFTGAVEFVTPVLQPNAGMLLRRRMDHGTGERLKADVFVDGEYAGIWYEPDLNFVGTQNRWHDSEFMIRPDLVSTQAFARIRIEPHPDFGPWNEYRYWVFCHRPLEWREDSDGDGIPDDWKLLYVEDIALLPAELDADEDGFTVLQEYIAGTDPTSDASFFHIAASDGQPFTFQSVLGRLYHLQRTSSLTEPVWETVRDNIPGSGGMIPLPISADVSHYYRLKVTKP